MAQDLLAFPIPRLVTCPRAGSTKHAVQRNAASRMQEILAKRLINPPDRKTWYTQRVRTVFCVGWGG